MPWEAELSQTSVMGADTANTPSREERQLMFLKYKKRLPCSKFKPRHM